jgi:hypothetical protein
MSRHILAKVVKSKSKEKSIWGEQGRDILYREMTVRVILDS